MLDHLGIGEFVTARLVRRRTAGAGLRGAAPRPVPGRGVDRRRGAVRRRGPGLVRRHGRGEPRGVPRRRAGPRGLRAVRGGALLPILHATPDELAEAIGGLVTPVDEAVVTADFADWMSRTFNHAGRAGRRSASATTASRRSARGASTSPTSGCRWRSGRAAQDAMVPFAHGELAGRARARAPRPHLFEDEGHLTLVTGSTRSSPTSRRSAGSAQTAYDASSPARSSLARPATMVPSAVCSIESISPCWCSRLIRSPRS